MTTISFSAYARLVRENANFRRLWVAQIVSEIGDWFYAVAIYQLLLEMTGRAEAVGLAFVLQVLPGTLIGPTAGVVNDRVRRKQVMIFTDLVRLVTVAAMLLVRSREMVWLVWPLLFLETVMWATFEPARNAVIPNITDEKDRVLANTLSAVTWSFNLAVGALFGGLVGAFAGRDMVFIFNTLSFAVSALLISGMEFHEPHAADMPPLRMRDLVDFTPTLEGVRYVRRDVRLLATVFVKAGIGIAGTSWVAFSIMGERLYPVRLRGMDESGAVMLGISLLMGARGVGALLGPLFPAAWAGVSQARMRLGILAGFLLESAGYMALSAAPNVGLACLCIILAHGGGSIIWVFSTTLLQGLTEDGFRGRVFSAELGFMLLTLAVSGWIAGAAIDHGVSVRTVAAMTGLAMLAPALAWALSFRLWKNPQG